MNLTIRDQPIFEDESQAKQALDDMANTLRLVSIAKSKLPFDLTTVLMIDLLNSGLNTVE